MMWQWSGGWQWMGMTSMIVFWGAVIAFAVWAVKRFAGGPSENRASKILEERFAKGEIDQAEFDSRRQVLASH
jgi:putative membrane protein